MQQALSLCSSSHFPSPTMLVMNTSDSGVTGLLRASYMPITEGVWLYSFAHQVSSSRNGGQGGKKVQSLRGVKDSHLPMSVTGQRSFPSHKPMTWSVGWHTLLPLLL